jgi:CMP-N-acetylneuraminic acid synthetase
MEVLGVIPARGGSKSIPRKNVAMLAGRPLLHYTCDAARGSARLTRVILSTDDEEIASVGRTGGVEAPFLRPAELGGDDVGILDVLVHALGWLEERDGYRPEAVVLLQPTSPFRRAEHIDGAVRILAETGADSVVSVMEVPHQFNPVSLMKLENERVLPFWDGLLILRRQDKPRLFARNGPAVLVTTRRTLLEGKRLYGDDCRPYVMTAEDSLDIDAAFDLEIADLLATTRERRHTRR